MAVAAVSLPVIAVREITPDIPLAVCLLVYLAAVSGEKLLRSEWLALAAGAAGGVAYLAKAYALPFVLLHLPLTILLAGRREGSWRMSLRSVTIALAGCSLVAGPWIAILSWRYGTFTLSTAARPAHAVGYSDDSQHPFAGTLPRNPYVFEFENPEEMPYVFWSPLASSEHFRHQLDVIRDNLLRSTRTEEVRREGMLWTIASFDRLHLGLAALALAPFAGLWLPPGRWRRAIWLAGTIMLFCAGFLPVYFAPRYVVPLALPLLLVLAMMLVLDAREGNRWRRPWAIARQLLALIIVASFASAAWASVGLTFAKSVSPGSYRRVAQQLIDYGIRGPIAGTPPHRLSWVALHMDRKAVVIAPSLEPQAMADRLRGFGVGAIIIWPLSKSPQTDPAMQVVRRLGWVPLDLRGPRRGAGGEGAMQVFVPPP